MKPTKPTRKAKNQAVSYALITFSYLYAGTVLRKPFYAGGVPLLGRNALADTMEDLIVDSVGALAIAVIGYISLKFRKGWVEKLLLKVHGKKEKE